MAHLIRMPRAAWRRQPQGGVSIHRGNPLTAALVDAWLPHQWGVNRVWPKNRLATVYQAGQDGRLAANPQNISSGTTGIEYFHPPCTLYARNTVVASWGGGTIYLAGSTGDGDGIGFAASPYEYLFSLQRNYTGISALSTTFGGSQITAGARHHLLARSLSNTFHEFTATNIKTGASSYRTATTDTSAIVFQDLGTVSFGYSGRLAPSLFVVWNRALDDAEIRALYQNPWQLFRPRPSRFILIPSSGGATTHDAALTLAYIAAFDPAANAQFNAGLTLSTLAGAMSGPSAQFNSALSLDTNVSITLQRALTALATVQMNMTAGQSVSALNAAVAAITESIACSYTSSVTANLLAGLSLAISQGLLSSTGATFNDSLTLALNAALTPSAQANYATQLSLLTTLQAALTAALSTSATLTLPASFTVTIDGEKFGNNDLALALNVQTGISTTATAILSAQLTLATQLLATPAGVGSFHSALTLANQLSTLFTTGSEISSSLSLAVSLALADAAAISLGGSLELGAVLSQVHSALAAFQAGLTLPTTLTAPMTGGLAMEGGISLAWTLGTNFDGSFFEITITLSTGRLVVIQASERMISIQASERLIQLLPTNPFVQV